MRPFPFLQKNERYCLLVVGRERSIETLLEITPDREIKEVRFRDNLKVGEFSHATSRISGSCKGIVGLHPGVAYSVSIPLEVKRGESHNEQLSGPEVENLLTKEVGQRFIQLRDEASSSLGIDQIDTILADSRVGDFRVNGRRVVHPVGCVAQTFEATTELTFTSRNLYEGIKKYFDRHSFFLGDAGRAVLQAAAKDTPLPLGILALDYPQSVYLKLNKNTAKEAPLQRATIPWSTNSLVDIIMTTWHVDREAAEEIWVSYSNDELPRTVKEFLENKFLKTLQSLEKTIKKIPSRGHNFITSSRTIPSDLLSLDKMIDPAPVLIERLNKMGFTINEELEPNFTRFPLILGVLEDYFSDRGHTDINRWLRRRLHWLGSVEYN